MAEPEITEEELNKLLGKSGSSSTEKSGGTPEISEDELHKMLAEGQAKLEVHPGDQNPGSTTTTSYGNLKRIVAENSSPAAYAGAIGEGIKDAVPNALSALGAAGERVAAPPTSTGEQILNSIPIVGPAALGVKRLGGDMIDRAASQPAGNTVSDAYNVAAPFMGPAGMALAGPVKLQADLSAQGQPGVPDKSIPEMMHDATSLSALSGLGPLAGAVTNKLITPVTDAAQATVDQAGVDLLNSLKVSPGALNPMEGGNLKPVMEGVKTINDGQNSMNLFKQSWDPKVQRFTIPKLFEVATDKLNDTTNLLNDSLLKLNDLPESASKYSDIRSIMEEAKNDVLKNNSAIDPVTGQATSGGAQLINNAFNRYDKILQEGLVDPKLYDIVKEHSDTLSELQPKLAAAKADLQDLENVKSIAGNDKKLPGEIASKQAEVSRLQQQHDETLQQFSEAQSQINDPNASFAQLHQYKRAWSKELGSAAFLKEAEDLAFSPETGKQIVGKLANYLDEKVNGITDPQSGMLVKPGIRQLGQTQSQLADQYTQSNKNYGMLSDFLEQVGKASGHLEKVDVVKPPETSIGLKSVPYASRIPLVGKYLVYPSKTARNLMQDELYHKAVSNLPSGVDQTVIPIQGAANKARVITGKVLARSTDIGVPALQNSMILQELHDMGAVSPDQLRSGVDISTLDPQAVQQATMKVSQPLQALQDATRFGDENDKALALSNVTKMYPEVFQPPKSGIHGEVIMGGKRMLPDLMDRAKYSRNVELDEGIEWNDKARIISELNRSGKLLD